MRWQSTCVDTVLTPRTVVKSTMLATRWQRVRSEHWCLLKTVRMGCKMVWTATKLEILPDT